LWKAIELPGKNSVMTTVPLPRGQAATPHPGAMISNNRVVDKRDALILPDDIGLRALGSPGKSIYTNRPVQGAGECSY